MKSGTNTWHGGATWVNHSGIGDADNYFAPFLVPNNFVGAHYCDDPKTVKTVKVGTRPCDIDKVLPLVTTEESASGATSTNEWR